LTRIREIAAAPAVKKPRRKAAAKTEAAAEAVESEEEVKA
jgi:hypothetical protein